MAWPDVLKEDYIWQASHMFANSNQLFSVHLYIRAGGKGWPGIWGWKHYEIWECPQTIKVGSSK